MTLRDSEGSVLRQDRDMGGRIDVTGFESCTTQYVRHRHCEAARMCRAEQFFGIRTLAVLKARVERIRAAERPIAEDLLSTMSEDGADAPRYARGALETSGGDPDRRADAFLR
jgi:hypothetical protein